MSDLCSKSVVLLAKIHPNTDMPGFSIKLFITAHRTLATNQSRYNFIVLFTYYKQTSILLQLLLQRFKLSQNTHSSCAILLVIHEINTQTVTPYGIMNTSEIGLYSARVSLSTAHLGKCMFKIFI